ncbi:hypothetical protein ECE50_025330 [Chitinophaga sp. Mgbs1]|uniref:Uncharacterized protein n=1 Tax=Chitinophaga solisilvae TaxID=1233460 RepID=A0A433WKR6_9BACT|nr:hypothetical protein [Chitinophaga solisilvae]
MKYCLSVLLFIIYIPIRAQQLTPAAIEKAAASLEAQQVLTAAGKAELLRFARQEPLKIYEGIPEAALQQITQNVFIADADMIAQVPGRSRIPKALLDSLSTLDKYPWAGHGSEFAEEYYLYDQFPSRYALVNFIVSMAQYYAGEHTQDLSYDNNRSLLVKRLGTLFGPAMLPVFQDSTLSFDVSPDDDTPAAQRARVQAFRPYLQWLYVFRQAGLVHVEDSLPERYYSDGSHIISGVTHLRFLQELTGRISFLDKYPYIKQQQLKVLDTLQLTGVINESARTRIISGMKPYALLGAEDIFPYCATAVPIYMATDIRPYDYIPRNDYGRIPDTSLKGFTERIVGRVSRKVLPLQLTDLQVHQQRPAANGLYAYQEQLALSRSAKITSLTMRLNNRLYKETIDEKEFESWIRPENFQFLNHYMEDTGDDRRFFLVSGNAMLRYGTEPDTVYLALLNSVQADALVSRYLFPRLAGCYNGSPGDYDYAVYPMEYFSMEERLSRREIDTILARCRTYNIIPGDTVYLPAVVREQNPRNVNDVLAFAGGYFSSRFHFNDLIAQTQKALQRVHPAGKTAFRVITEDDMNDTGIWEYTFNGKPYRITATGEEELFRNDLLVSSINAALNANGTGYTLIPLPDRQDALSTATYGEGVYILAPREAEQMIRFLALNRR